MPKPIPAPREEGFTTTTGSPLYWAKYGRPGAPKLLVLHGGPGADHRYLLPQMLHLGEKHDLLFYDQRGGGRSRADARIPITWETHVEDLGAVVEQFGLDPLSIVGYSWGAMLGLLYAIEQGANPHLRAPNRLALISAGPLTSGVREKDPDAYRQRAFELGVAGYFSDPRRATDLTPFRVVGRVQESVWESLGDFDLISDLKGIKIPSIIVSGRDDPIPLASSSEAANALGTNLVVLDECGHVPYVEQPQGLFKALDPFLDESTPSVRS